MQPIKLSYVEYKSNNFSEEPRTHTFLIIKITISVETVVVSQLKINRIIPYVGLEIL